MQIKAKLRYLRIAPRKVRLVADLVRDKNVQKAQQVLNFVVKKASLPILKLLNSAMANARNNFQIDPENLYISKITVDEGPKFKRWMPRARGTAYEIQKKTSHITLVLDEIEPSKKIRRKKIRSSEKKMVELVSSEKKEITQKIKKQRPIAETEKPKPKSFKSIRRIFSRKAM